MKNLNVLVKEKFEEWQKINFQDQVYTIIKIKKRPTATSRYVVSYVLRNERENDCKGKELKKELEKSSTNVNKRKRDDPRTLLAK